MTIQHHPDDDLLLAYATGRAEAGVALLVATHLETCRTCRARLGTLEAVGGALLAEAEPEPLATDAWARALETVSTATSPAAGSTLVSPAVELPHPALPDGVPWPRSLRHCTASPWHWMGPGMRWSRVTLAQDPAASLFLLRIGPGRSLPRHSHSELELTQVLCGTFDDGRAMFAPGDFDAADPDVLHQPVVRAGAECVCLAFVSGRLRFEGRIASWIGGWIGM